MTCAAHWFSRPAWALNNLKHKSGETCARKAAVGRVALMLLHTEISNKNGNQPYNILRKYHLSHLSKLIK